MPVDGTNECLIGWFSLRLCAPSFCVRNGRGNVAFKKVRGENDEALFVQSVTDTLDEVVQPPPRVDDKHARAPTRRWQGDVCDCGWRCLLGRVCFLTNDNDSAGRSSAIWPTVANSGKQNPSLHRLLRRQRTV
jgi:hypothetical protein